MLICPICDSTLVNRVCPICKRIVKNPWVLDDRVLLIAPTLFRMISASTMERDEKTTL